MNKDTLFAGEAVFAKVKGYIPYPAKILGRQENTKKEMYTVFFYGTQETGVVGRSMVWSVTSDSIQRFVS